MIRKRLAIFVALAVSCSTIFACAPSPASEPRRDGFEVLVLNDETGGPVADAEVRFVDLRMIKDAELRREWQTPGNIDTILDRYSLSFQTGEEGLAKVPLLREYGVVAARHEGRWGHVWISPGCAKLVQIRLKEDPTLKVRVTDHEGEPVVGAPVVLWFARGDQRFHGGRFVTEGPGGIASLPHARSRVEESTDAFVIVDLPLGVNVWSPLNPQQISDEPYELRLPPTGRVVVEVSRPEVSASVRAEYQVEVQPLGRVGEGDADYDRFAGVGKGFTRGGKVVLEHVGLGLRLAVSARVLLDGQAHAYAGPRSVIDGPEGVDGSTAVRIVGPSPPDIVRLALSDQDGKPVKEETIVLSYLKEGGGGSSMYRTSPKGHLKIPITHPTRDDQPTDYVACWQPEPGIARVAYAKISLELRPGENDQGDLVFEDDAPFAAGRVVDQAGRPVPGAIVELNPETILGEQAGLELSGSVSVQTDEDGRFEFHGKCLAGDSYLWATKAGFIASERVRALVEPTEDEPLVRTELELVMTEPG